MQDRSMPPPGAHPPLPDFTPVPRRVARVDGWTPDRQRGFIAALARTGSVTSAARAVNMAHATAYDLRNHPQGGGFRAAWDAALALGVQRLADVVMERAIDGVADPVFWRGEQVGERRRYNDRLAMFVLRHHTPERYGALSLGGHRRSKATVEREAAENCPVCRERAEAEAQAAADQPGEEACGTRVGQELLGMYAAKIEAERRHRMAGEVIAADFALRQLTHLEVMLEAAGLGEDLLDRWTTRPGEWGGAVPVHVGGISAFLSEAREAFWAHIGAPVRPALRVDPTQCNADGRRGGPNHAAREAAQRAAQARIAAAQAEWEAAATEDGWAAWRGAA